MLDHMQLTLTVRVQDVAAAVPWYEAVFGVPAIYRGVDTALDGRVSAIACFRIAGVKIWLSKMPEEVERTTAMTDLGVTITFMTRQPMAALRASLVARGAISMDVPSKSAFEPDAQGIRHSAETEFFYIHDPDGNRFEFCRILMAPA